MWKACEICAKPGDPENSAGVSEGMDAEVVMYTGTMIEDLMQTVQKMEREARLAEAAQRSEFPLWSTYMYEWPMLEQAIGVA